MARPKPRKWTPKNPSKYMGDSTNIVSRSSWETKAFNWMDLNSSVIMWNSEELVIPYYSPVDQKMHRYHPDILARMKTKVGEKNFLIEIKPNKERYPSTAKNKKQYITEMCTYAINIAKWKAAEEFCKKQGIIFLILDEFDLGIKKRPTI